MFIRLPNASLFSKPGISVGNVQLIVERRLLFPGLIGSYVPLGDITQPSVKKRQHTN